MLAMGDEDARSLGINVPRVRLLLVLAATLMTATAVSISGIIAWVELLIPHIVQMLVGPNFHAVLPMCAVVGGGYLLAVDTLCRAISTSEMPLGILARSARGPLLHYRARQDAPSMVLTLTVSHLRISLRGAPPAGRRQLRAGGRRCALPARTQRQQQGRCCAACSGSTASWRALSGRRT